jgi:hypothetical protein
MNAASSLFCLGCMLFVFYLIYKGISKRATSCECESPRPMAQVISIDNLYVCANCDCLLTYEALVRYKGRMQCCSCTSTYVYPVSSITNGLMSQ